MPQTDYETRPDQQTDDTRIDEFHDRTLWAFTSAATELAALGYTAGMLMRLVERHLTPEAAPFASGESDPFAGSAA